MKKFLSICLVALCSVSAMYAQNANSESNVECGKEVTVKATANNGYHHFVKWEIQNTNGSSSNVLLTVHKNGNFTYDPNNNSSNHNYGATVSPGVDNGKETNTLSLELDGTLIGDANLGTVTFEAFFAEDSYTINGTTEGGGTVEFNHNGTTNSTVTGTTTGANSVTLTAHPDNCSVFVGWKKDGADNLIPGATELTFTVNPEESWADGSEHTYTAVFETKKININAKSNDTNMGTVTLTIADPAPATPQQ